MICGITDTIQKRYFGWVMDFLGTLLLLIYIDFFTEFGGSNYFYKAKYNIIACIQMIYYFSLHVDKRISTYLQLGGCKL